MGHDLSNAFSVLIVGMITVFFILWLVVMIGNILIRITNKFWPDSEINKHDKASDTGNKKTIAAIIAAVDIFTHGKGKVTNIKKI